MANRISYGILGLGLLFATPLFAQSATIPPKVVDANGKFVGWPRSLVAQGYTNQLQGVERNVNGVWVVLETNHGGFVQDNFFVLFTSSDCSGSKYMDASVLPPAGWIVISNTQPTLFFPGTPVQLLTIQSFRTFLDPTTTCNSSVGTPPIWVGRAQSVDVNSLGLVPPFTVK